MPGSSSCQLASNRCADVRTVGSGGRRDQHCDKDADGDTVQLAHDVRLCSKRVEGQVMRNWLRSVIDAILGRIPGKTSRPDTATRMAMDADFSGRDESMPAGLRRWRERDDGHLVKPDRLLADVDPLEELIRVVKEAQESDAEDERRLYHPMRGDRPSFQRRRPDRR
jgi:hypothetical protein